MMFRYYILTLVLVALVVQSIQSKKCNKVKCNDPPIRSCGNASVLIDVGGNNVGGKAHLSCLNGYTLWGNDSIVCLDSGKWSQLNSYCIPDEIGDPNIQLFDGSLYLFNNSTLRKRYNQAKKYCTNICSTLIEINNQEEDQFLYRTFKNLEIGKLRTMSAYLLETDNLWIGIESVNGGIYSWQSGNTTQTNMYENWNEELFPFVNDPPAGACSFASKIDTYWNPEPLQCFVERAFVCEIRNN